MTYTMQEGINMTNMGAGMILGYGAAENEYKKASEQKDYIITLQNIIIQQQNQLALKDQQIKNLMTMLQEERERNS